MLVNEDTGITAFLYLWAGIVGVSKVSIGCWNRNEPGKYRLYRNVLAGITSCAIGCSWKNKKEKSNCTAAGE